MQGDIDSNGFPSVADLREKLRGISHDARLAASALTEAADVARSQSRGDVRLFLSEAYLRKLVFVCEGMLIEDQNPLFKAVSLRFTLEMLIHTRLFLKEPPFLFKAYYSILMHQKEKAEVMIRRIKFEIDMLNEMEALEKKQFTEKVKPAIAKANELGETVSAKDRAAHILTAMKETEDYVNAAATEEISPFIDSALHLGFGFAAHLLTEQNLKKYQAHLDYLLKIKDNMESLLIKDTAFQRHFNVGHQKSKVLSALKDGRDWGQKAKDAGLEREFDFAYSYTSSLIHAVSFATFTPSELSDSEVFLLLTLQCQYAERIRTDLQVLCGLP